MFRSWRNSRRVTEWFVWNFFKSQNCLLAASNRIFWNVYHTALTVNNIRKCSVQNLSPTRPQNPWLWAPDIACQFELSMIASAGRITRCRDNLMPHNFHTTLYWSVYIATNSWISILLPMDVSVHQLIQQTSTFDTRCRSFYYGRMVFISLK